MRGFKGLFDFHLLELTLNGRGSNSIRDSNDNINKYSDSDSSKTTCNKKNSNCHNSFCNNIGSCIKL